MKSKFKLKDIVVLLLIIFIFWDFFLNDRILLTKFSITVTSFASEVFGRIGEWYAKIFTSIN